MNESKRAEHDDGPSAWAEDVRAIAGGNQSALGRLYDQTSPIVYGLVLRIVGDPADADEVTLDVYTQVWRSARHFDSHRGTVRAWLVMVARSRAIDRIRSKAGRRRREQGSPEMPILPDTSPNPEVAAEIGQQRRIIAHALNALTVAERQLIEMVYFEGLSHSELSQRTGLPLGTVKTRIRSGMIKLREQLSVWESGTWRTRRT